MKQDNDMAHDTHVRRSCDISISLIKMDRYPMNPKTLDLIKFLQNGGTVPPIKVAKLKSGGFIIRDGRHRILAYKMLGISKINAKFSTKPISNYV